MENIRKISQQTLKNVLSTMPQVIKDTLPDTPENILPYVTRERIPSIAPTTDPKVKQMMLDNLLSDEDYLKAFYSIVATSFYNKRPVAKPTFHLVVGQTGSGKSNVSAKILSESSNVITIDSDKYKQFRPDDELLAAKNPTLYGILTRLDAYGHRDNIYDYAIANNYNVLMEIAPSLKNGVFIDISELIDRGYKIDISALAVSKLNSALSVHERYEGQIEAKLQAPKLTELSRHNESFESLNKIIKEFQTDERLNINIYKRASSSEGFPDLIYSTTGNNKYSCPYHALHEMQSIDGKAMEQEFEKRYNSLLQQMKKRNAPNLQYDQLEEIKKMYISYVKEGNRIM